MATSFNDIYDLALVTINDYRLNKLYETDKEQFMLYMQGLLIKSIPMIQERYGKSLEFSIESKSFNEDLPYKIKQILADAINIVWFESLTNVTAYVNNGLQGRDKKTHSASENLKIKMEYLDRLREKLYQDINDYHISHLEV